MKSFDELHRTIRTRFPGATLGSVLLAFLLLLGGTIYQVSGVQAQANLTVDIVAGYNLVVDSNATSPSTYAPSVATVMGRFCNQTGADMTNVIAYIGDSTTPGQYPQLDSSTDLPVGHPLEDTGIYAFRHIGGRIGSADATRYIGTVPAGECVVQYWHFEYPRCRNEGGVWRDPPCVVPTWGTSVKPDDDLSLSFDIWATADGGYSDSSRWTMTMRNEISAMANKIKPNPDGRWFNTNDNAIQPGDVITSNGILYELGNINQGFDNNGDFVPDYNAWLQPVGDPDYDPSCFRLIRTTGIISISRSGGNPDMYVHFDDREESHPTYGGPLYFTDLPPDNTGVIGEVRYTFLALDGPCSTRLTPYQEVASGFDNEKFNGDFGGSIPPVGSSEPQVEVDKDGNITVSPGDPINYTINYNNKSSDPVGLPLNSMPLVFSDTIPADTTFVSAGGTGVTVLYSTDDGATWRSTAPGDPSTVTTIQWWFDDPLGGLASGSVSLNLEAAALPSSPFIENCLDARLGNGVDFDRDCQVTMVQGSNSIGDLVWGDTDTDGLYDSGTESGLDNIEVSLYWDKNGDGTVDEGDVLIDTDTTAAGGAYLFDGLPDGEYLVQVDHDDADLPAGYRLTTSQLFAVDLNDPGDVAYLDADFGFGPALSIDKALSSGDPAYEGEQVVYTIDLTNNLPGDGTGQGASCQYTVWAGHNHLKGGGDVPASNNMWTNEPNALGAPDGVYAESDMGSGDDFLGLGNFLIGPQLGNITNVTATLYFRELAEVESSQSMEYHLYIDNAEVLSKSTEWFSTDFNQTAPADYQFTVDLSDLTWDWSHFQSDRTETLLSGQKSGGNPAGIVGLDAIGYVITTDQACGGSDGTISPLPVTDTYDPAKLTYLSADPEASSVEGGTVTWDDLGPLYAGQTKQITVTFVALDSIAPTTHNNCADSGGTLGATFLDGVALNDVQDCTSHDIDPAGTIGDLVWNDNGSVPGTYESGTESGIAGVTVNLYADADQNGAPDGVAIATTTTDDNGAYLFAGLQDGYYIVQVDTSTLPGGASGTSNTHDLDTDDDSDSGTIEINNTDGDTSNDDELDADFGFSLPSRILGSIWHDRDQSGTASADSGEERLSGITVYLDDGSCSYPGDCVTATTDSEGVFVFDGVTPGSYTVRVDTSTGLTGWTQTYDGPSGGGLDDAVPVTVNAGDVKQADYSYYQSGSTTIGDTLYTDWNGDGTLDSGEEGIANVTVWLYEDDDGDGVIDDGVDALIATTTTANGSGADPLGYYEFANLPADQFIVVVDESDSDLPGTYAQSGDPDEADTCTVCDARGSADTTSGDDLDADFGYRPLGSGSIGDRVWNDADGDGIQDGGESGIANITVNLYEDSNNDGVIDSGDALVATTATDSSGLYAFANLPAGNYLVDVDTDDDDLPNDGNGNDYVLSTDNDPHDVTLTSGQAYVTADFGFTAGGVIGDLIWQDDNGDGVPDANEAGINGVTVNLYQDNNNDGQVDGGDTLVATTATATNPSTGKDGYYLFTSFDANNNGLPSGNYVVEVDTTTLPAGFASTSQTGDPDENSPPQCTTCDSVSGLNGSAPSLPLYGLDAGQWDLTRDFGYQPSVRIGDTLWLDVDNSGTRVAGESGIPYITVELWNCGSGTCSDGDETQEASTATDSAGYYSFGNLSDGTYQVRVDTSDPEMPPVTNTYDPDATTDSQAIVEVSGGVVTSVGGSCTGDCSLDVDFGYQYSGDYDLSGTVFFDDDNDGGPYTPGDGDLPYENITVYLWNSDGLLIATTTTLSDGSYTFANLPNGDYTVSVNKGSPKLQDLTMSSDPDEVGQCTVCNGYTPVTISGADETGNDFGLYAGIDFGDLPDSYGTKLSSEGPRHTIGELYLGSAVDVDGDGQPTSAADGDDNDGSNDEDGVTFQSVSGWTAGGSVTLDVDVTGSGGYLVGFFDWNGDGDFGDADETRVYGSASGSFTWDVSIPGGATFGGTNRVHARFRLYDGKPIAVSPSGQATNGEVEDYQWSTEPTAVTLAAFTGTPEGRAILLQWQTASEIGIVGFDLYRGESPDGPRTQLNAGLIPAGLSGTPEGNSYQFLDTSVQANRTYYYWLSDVDANGGGTLHGPISVLAPSFANWEYHLYLPVVNR